MTVNRGATQFKRFMNHKHSGTVFFLGLFALFTLVLSFIGLITDINNIERAKKWLETPCIILSSNYTEEIRTKGGNFYVFNIEYSYTHDNLKYKSTRYNFYNDYGGWYFLKFAIKKRLAKFPAGKNTVCYVNPANPGESVLIRGGRLGVRIYTLAFFILSIIIFRFFFKEFKKIIKETS